MSHRLVLDQRQPVLNARILKTNFETKGNRYFAFSRLHLQHLLAYFSALMCRAEHSDTIKIDDVLGWREGRVNPTHRGRARQCIVTEQQLGFAGSENSNSKHDSVNMARITSRGYLFFFSRCGQSHRYFCPEHFQRIRSESHAQYH